MQSDNVAAMTLAEYDGVDCLKTAKLNLNQCLSVAGPHYEDVYCAGRHGVSDTGKCVSQAATGGTATDAAPAPRLQEAQEPGPEQAAVYGPEAYTPPPPQRQAPSQSRPPYGYADNGYAAPQPQARQPQPQPYSYAQNEYAPQQPQAYPPQAYARQGYPQAAYPAQAYPGYGQQPQYPAQPAYPAPYSQQQPYGQTYPAQPGQPYYPQGYSTPQGYYGR